MTETTSSGPPPHVNDSEVNLSWCLLMSRSPPTLLAVLYSIIFVVGLVGNVVALSVFFCLNMKKNSVRVFLINVAFADLLLLMALPFRIYYHSQGNVWDLNPTLFNIQVNVIYFNTFISFNLLGLISVDRCMKFHRTTGVQQRRKSTKWSRATCAFIWITIIVIGCVDITQEHHPTWRVSVNITTVVLFWFVFFGLVVSYGKIATSLLKRSQNKADLPNAARYGRAAKKSFFILFIFTVCFVPDHVFRTFYIMMHYTDPPCCYWICTEAISVTQLLLALNSCLDPVMYFLLSSSMRKEVTRVLSAVCGACVARVARSREGAAPPMRTSTLTVDGVE